MHLTFHVQFYMYFELLQIPCAGSSGFHCGSLSNVAENAPDISPSANPQPFLPLLAPLPLTPFTNNSVTLSGMFFKLAALRYCLVISDNCQWIDLLCDMIFS